MKVKAIKGTDENMRCQGFQYEPGGEYEHSGEVKCCPSSDDIENGRGGFHACKLPHECFKYYQPGRSRFFEVELSGDIKDNSDDSKICGKKIKFGAEINVKSIVKSAVSVFFELFEFKKKISSIGAANAGNRGAANAGNRGAANAGNRGAANAGSYGAAIARHEGKATTGKKGVAVAYGYNSKAKGGLGAMLVFVEADKAWTETGEFKAVLVDGKTVKADTFYQLKDGELVEFTYKNENETGEGLP